MNKSFGFSLVLSLAFLCSFVGCGPQCGIPSAPSDNSEAAPSAETPDESTDSKPELDETPLDVDNPNTPEGVVNEFFKTFFSGDAEGAFALLTTRAQEAKRDQFNAQESETVRWTITKKTKPVHGRALVFVDVEDYTDAGSIQMDELTFVLTNDDYTWRIAGFSVGDLAVNFEGGAQETIVQKGAAFPVKTARTVDEHSAVH
ncbi:MAG: hypothetical protein IJM54_01145 [Thermoguttaceae bacterium]|nr:hypothetical protein [Thermoguttaceae bacterium]